MRRAAAVLSSVALGAGTVAVGAAPAEASIDGDRFQVVSRTWSEHWEDTGEKGESVGDSYTFTEKLFHRGERVGRDAGRCEVTRVGPYAFGMNCVVTVTFRNRGDLTVQGAITYKRGRRNAPELAITGGTGEYKGASGVVKLVDRRGEPSRLRFRLHS